MSAAPIGYHPAYEMEAGAAAEMTRRPVDFALAYAAIGWPVFPIQPIRGGACACGRPHGPGDGECASPGKHPFGALVPDGYKDATIDPEIIRRWWEDVPDAHIGVRLDAAGLIAVDIDPRNGGDPRDLPFDIDRTLTATTGGGGLHGVYRVPAGMEAAKSPWVGVDLKHHGYIVCEPSGHESGGHYAWRDWDVLSGEMPEVPAAPGELLKPVGSMDAAATFGTEHINEREIFELRATLATFSSDDRETWIRVGHALASIKNEGVGFELWDTWSNKSEKYDARDQARRWNGFAGTRSNWRAVFTIAQQHGGQIVSTPISDDFKLQIYETLINGLTRRNAPSVAPTSAGAEDREREPMFKLVGVPTPSARRRYELLRASELAALPPVAWAVRNVLPRGGVAAVYGAPGSGKTFLALDLAAALAEGLELWFGRPVRRAPVVYVALEGGSGLAARCKARELHTGRPPPDDLYFVVRQDFNFDRPADVDGLLAAVCEKLSKASEPPVIIIDTLARAAVGLEENSATDMGKVVDAAYRIANETGGLVLLIHHPGKSADGGLRGSSTLLGAMDAVIKVEVTPSGPRWTLEKSKDGPPGEEGSFQLVQVEVGEDDQGDPVTSAVVVQSSVPTKASAELPPGQRAARHALVDAAKRSGTLGPDGDSVWVQVEQWRDAFYAMQADATDGARRKAFTRARKALRQAGYTEEVGEAVRLNEAMDVLQAAEAIRQRDIGT